MEYLYKYYFASDKMVVKIGFNLFFIKDIGIINYCSPDLCIEVYYILPLSHFGEYKFRDQIVIRKRCPTIWMESILTPPRWVVTRSELVLIPVNVRCVPRFVILLFHGWCSVMLNTTCVSFKDYIAVVDFTNTDKAGRTWLGLLAFFILQFNTNFLEQGYIIYTNTIL